MLVRWASLLLGVAGALAPFAADTARADSRVLVLGLEARASAAGPGTSAPVSPLTAAELVGLDRALIARIHSEERLHSPRDTVRVGAVRAEVRCGAIDDGCLARFAERRQVDRVLYGTAARLAPGGDAGEDSARDRRDNRESRVEVVVHVFDLYTRSTRETVSGFIESRHLDSESHLAGLVEKLVSLVVRVPEEGAATIRAIAGSTVTLDERSMGAVPASGELVLRPLRVGRRSLRVVRPNHTIWEAPIVVRTRESIQVTVDSGASVASADEAVAARGAEVATTHAPARGSDGSIHPPPEYILSVPGGSGGSGGGGSSGASASGDVWHAGEGLSHVVFRIPILEEHIASGEIRTATHARVGFLPNVSSSGARVTAKLHF